MTVPGLGDGAESRPIAARVLARDEAEVAGELRGALEAAPVDNLGGEHHGRVDRDAAKALEARDHRRERRRRIAVSVHSHCRLTAVSLTNPLEDAK